MASFDSGRAYNMAGINLNDDRGNSLNGIRFDSNRTAPNSADDFLIYRRAGALYLWDGSTETNLGAGGGGAAGTLDSIYDNGRTITVDNGAVVLAGTDEDTAVLSITGDGDSAGALISLSHTTNTRNDISGTSVWSITGQGVATLGATTVLGLATVGSGSASGEITSNGAYNLVLQTNDGTNSSEIEIVDGVNGDVDITLDGTGAVNINGTTTHNDALVVADGDISVTTGHVDITDDQNEASLAVTNATATTIGAAAAGGVVQLDSASLTTGALLSLELTENTLNGGWYVRAWDATASAQVFSVGENGAVTITGNTAGTDSLTVTNGDLFISDTDGSVIESEDGTATTLTVDNKAGVVASDSAVLLVDAGGAVASGGNALRVIFSGTAAADAILAEFLPDAGSVGIKVEGGGVDTDVALWVDADPTADNVAYIHSDAVIASDKAVLNVESAGAIASGGNAMRVDVQGTPASGAVYAEFDFAGLTDTNENVGVLIDAGGKKVQALSIDADPIAGDVALIHSDAVIASDKALLQLDSAGAVASGGTVERIVLGGSPNAGAIALEISASVDAKAVEIATSAATNDAVLISGAGNLATTKALLHVTDAGTPAADDVSVIHAAFTGTATNESRILFADGDGKDVVGLYIDTDNTVAQNSGSIVLYSNAAGASGPSLVVDHDSASPAADDQIFGIFAWGEEATSGDEVQYAQQTFEVLVSTNTATEGAIKMAVDDAGTLRESFFLTDDTLALGDSAAFVLGSNGSQDLSISTAITSAGLAANEPKIVLTDGATGNITITAGGTSGEIDLASPVLMSSTQSVGTGNEAINLTTSITEITTDADGTAHTLADGVEGQMKFIVLINDAAGGDAVVTPTNLTGFSTITFSDDGEAVTLLFTNSSWVVVGNNGAVLA